MCTFLGAGKWRANKPELDQSDIVSLFGFISWKSCYSCWHRVQCLLSNRLLWQPFRACRRPGNYSQIHRSFPNTHSPLLCGKEVDLLGPIYIHWISTIRTKVHCVPLHMNLLCINVNVIFWDDLPKSPSSVVWIIYGQCLEVGSMASN